MIEDEKGKEYIHLSTPHKRTFMHMGSTFNPQYNVIKNTDGTSLSYTTQLSTTFVGDDNETIVDRARVTLIGRGVMQSTDVTGKEVAVLLGNPFITALEGDEAPDDTAQAALNSAIHDQGTGAGLAATAAGLWAALKAANPPPAPGDPGYPAFLIAVGNAVTATQNADAPIQDTQTDVNNWVAAFPAGPNALAAQGLASTAAGASTTAVTLANAALTAATGGTITANDISALATQTATVSTDIAAVKAKLAFDTSSLPDSPNSNVQGTFINILRGASGTDPVPPPNTPISLPGSDFTAMDILTSEGTPAPRRTDHALNAGSDIKIVGGDNVNLVAFDSRSHTIGTSYGLVLGGQASVVRNGQQSKVMAPANSVASAVPSLTAPTTFTPLAFPLSPVDATSTTAQTSEVYGNQFSWINGATSSTVTSGSKAMVIALGTRPVPLWSNLDWSDVAPDTGLGTPFTAAVTPPNPTSDHTIAQVSAAMGHQWSFVDGDQHVKITGHKTANIAGGQTTNINGGQSTTADTQETHVKNSYKTAVSAEDITWAFKFGMCTGLAISVNTLAINLTGVSLSLHIMAISNRVFELDEHGFHASTKGFWAIV